MKGIHKPRNWFTVDGKYQFSKTCRLQTSGKFVSYTHEGLKPLSEQDVVYQNVWHAISAVKKLGDVVIMDGKPYRVNPTTFAINDTDVLFLSPRIHRGCAPRQIHRLQLTNVIDRSDDANGGTLIIGINGNLGLYQSRHDISQNPQVAVYYSAFKPGSDLLGEWAARDVRYVRKVFAYMLQAWLTHLKTGELGVFASSEGPRPDIEQLMHEQEVLTKILVHA